MRSLYVYMCTHLTLVYCNGYIMLRQYESRHFYVSDFTGDAFKVLMFFIMNEWKLKLNASHQFMC